MFTLLLPRFSTVSVMALDLEKLRAIARGEFPTSSKSGVTDVTGVAARVSDVTRTLTSNAWRNDSRNHWCGCSAIGVHGRGWSIPKPELAVWVCEDCWAREKFK